MKMLILVVILMVILIVPKQGQCYHGGYSPGYEPFAVVKHFPLQKCELIGTASCESTTYGCKFAGNVSLNTKISADNESTRIEIEDSSGHKTIAKTRYHGYCHLLDEIEVYIGDLNRDKTPDIIIVLPGTGFGLASEYCDAIFALSSQRGYVFVGMITMGFGPEDAIDFYRNGKCQIIHTSFIYGELGKDGKQHNYWVYNFFEVDGTEIRLSKKILPRWIMFAGKQNHRPTRQLSEKQKIRLWEQQNRPFFMDFIE